MKIMLEKKVGRRRNALFPSAQDSVGSAVVPLLKFSTKARPVELEQKICFNLQSPKRLAIGVVLAKQCENIGLTLKQCKGKSDRVCSACGRKIRTSVLGCCVRFVQR